MIEFFEQCLQTCVIFVALSQHFLCQVDVSELIWQVVNARDPVAFSFPLFLLIIATLIALRVLGKAVSTRCRKHGQVDLRLCESASLLLHSLLDSLRCVHQELVHRRILDSFGCLVHALAQLILKVTRLFKVGGDNGSCLCYCLHFYHFLLEKSILALLYD